MKEASLRFPSPTFHDPLPVTQSIAAEENLIVSSVQHEIGDAAAEEEEDDNRIADISASAFANALDSSSEEDDKNVRNLSRKQYEAALDSDSDSFEAGMRGIIDNEEESSGSQYRYFFSSNAIRLLN